MSAGIVLLGSEALTTNIIYHALCGLVPEVRVILEKKVSRAELVRRRVKRLGLQTVAGQVLFTALVQAPLARLSRRRVRQITREHGLDDSSIPSPAVTKVSSVNSNEAIECLRGASPAVVVLSGTRILSKETLAATDARIINIHAGITPLYRGVHGGYWALAKGDPAHCGVTVHLVDAGIDTGEILGQARIEPTDADNVTTYPVLQVAAALPLLTDAVSAALRGELKTRPAPRGQSRLWSHPTLRQYLAARLVYGVR
jgi:folate-dependent phosphoribosylglycinamide formyltransferase PurN